MVDQKPFEKFAVRELYGHRRRVYTLGWNSTGKRLASGSSDYNIRIWDVEPYAQVAKSERAVLELKGHSDSVSSLAWKPTQPDHLASTTGNDKTVRLWDCRTGKPSSTITTPSGNLNLSWHPDGNTLAVVNKDNTINFVDVRKGKIVRTWKSPSAELNEIMWHPEGGHILVGTSAGTVDVLEVQPSSLEVVNRLQAHSSTCCCLTMSKDKRYLATGGLDAVVTLWDVGPDMVCLRTFPRMDMPVRAVSFSHDSQYLSYASEDGMVEIVSVSTGELLHTIHLRTFTDSVVWSPSHHVMAYTEEKEDNNSRDGSKLGYVCIMAPPKQ